MTRLKIQRCKTCHMLGVGPNAVKLYPLDDLLYCERGTPKDPGCYRQALAWHESRPNIILALMFEIAKPREVKELGNIDWRPYIYECCEMAAWALDHDRRTFVHYFARAVYAWTLREIK